MEFIYEKLQAAQDRMCSVALVSYLLRYEPMTNSSRQYIHRVTTVQCFLTFL